ncbi:hypothetical protein Y032_0074g822 [Ancylostoma ceylanicum]|uniref:Uncharacterized protein n=1 Tax=Ancylostoma ceylanicum TaxID=53326 RepID=A0A016TWD1_9BILA|nr:hypothetical protein Y032_0074g822 [Ancylostoma ceylanicum]
MPLRPRFKEERSEKATELLRLYLERTGTMDALTGWLRKVVEVPAEERPRDALEHLKKNQNQWHGNIRSAAIKNMLEDVQEELAEVLEENRELKRKIAHIEAALLARKVAALNASTKHQKEVSSAAQGTNNTIDKRSVEINNQPSVRGIPYYVVNPAAIPTAPDGVTTANPHSQ